jgi:AAA15 family ATPase/GTPase
MAIQRIVIENYRSIEHLDLEFGPINALIGPNNSGKSNILRALNLILGEIWPTRPLPDNDFHKYDTSKPVQITVTFAMPLVCDGAVQGFRLRYNAGESGEYWAVDSKGKPCMWPSGQPKRVSNQMREECALLYLDLERQADRQVRATQWTLYGKLLRQIEKSIGVEDKEKFTKSVAASFDSYIRKELVDAQKIVDDFVRAQTGLRVNLEFKASDPLTVLKSVRPFVVDEALNFDTEEVGAGVQSAVAISIAKAYADLVRVPLVMGVEEPELYLHPHACRHFYRLLQDLSVNANLQMIYTTHSRAFLDAGEFEAINIVRRAKGVTNVKSGRSLSLATTSRERLKIQSKFNERINEVFFASCVVLTEGPADEIACRCALEREKIELDRQSVSIISLGGKQEIPTVSQVLVGFDIPTTALLDEDPGGASTAAVHSETSAVLGGAEVFLQRPNLEGLFGLSKKLNRVEAMTFFPSWFANASNATPQVYLDLAARIRARLS